MDLTNGLTVIGHGMFEMDGGAALLSAITIPSNLTSVGKGLILLWLMLFYVDKVKFM